MDKCNLLCAIGNTPLIKIGNIYAKLESVNPSGSIKDRIALEIIEAAEKIGDLIAIMGEMPVAHPIGGLVEWLQTFVGRESSWGDVRRDVLGAAIAAALLPGGSAGCAGRVSQICIVAIASGWLLLVDVRPMAMALVDEYHARRQFPVLSDFSTPFESGRWSSSIPATIDQDIGAQNAGAVRISHGERAEK